MKRPWPACLALVLACSETTSLVPARPDGHLPGDGPTAADGGADAGPPPVVNCAGDPDRPDECSHWTCATVAAEVRCTASLPEGSAPAPAAYTCPVSGGDLPTCPGNDAGGTGTWSCTAQARLLACTRGLAPTPTPGGRYPGAGTGGADTPLPGGVIACFRFGDAAVAEPDATVEHAEELLAGVPALHVRLTVDPRHIDNTFGVNTIGWPGRHRLDDLASGNRAELQLTSRDGPVVLDFKIDYLSKEPGMTGRFLSLGLGAPDGGMIVGAAADVVATATSIDRNLRERGYATYLLDSPATDTLYTPNVDAPGWDYRVVYEAWVRTSVFGASGAGSVRPVLVHASPSKTGQDTMTPEPRECPAGWGR
jgi:hypothetical protein